ncbi:hypothetical protein RvY_12793-1 [Ramazzottius varieornatus]|uniref:Uncharacterized protein n=1 Tax=Ramazzottius varieornatus TaxID=947166 RepID=A0A1D1VKQ9_RAMVA|nr:hypothetical protein RvY_12793-1 [Ramazzottius varieornatus]
MRLFLHCEELNDTFGNILFLIVILDLLVAFGFTACLVGNDGGKVVVTNVFDIISIVIFMAYTTIYAWPMVSAYAQSTKTGGLVAQLMFEIELRAPYRQLEAENEQEETKSLLLTFLIGSKDQVLLIVAGGPVSITRGFVVTTLTLLLSFLLITREFSKYKF